MEESNRAAETVFDAGSIKYTWDSDIDVDGKMSF